MRLDFFRNLCNKNQSNINEQFIEELSKELDKTKEENELGIIETVKQENKVSDISEIKMLKKQNEIIKEYANGENLYFISKKDNEKGNYIVFNFEQDKKHTIRMTEEEIPANAQVNSIFKEESGKFIIDMEGTEHIQNEIKKMTEEVLKEQNEELENYRQEGHLYLVREDINDKVYLIDITSNPGYAVEEVDFPEDLKNEATEGTIFKYENGAYKFYERK